MTPCILLQGIARFDAFTNVLARYFEQSPRLSRWFDQAHYFKGIKTFLTDRGFPTYHTSVPFAASLKERSRSVSFQIKDIVNQAGAKAHLIGHSMGGLDARYAVATYGLDRYVEIVSTIGTPHHGTSFADWGMVHNGDEIVRAIHPFLHIEGVEDLTRDSARARNAALFHDECYNAVEYRAYAASQAEAGMFEPLKPSWEIISSEEGENDGLVSRKSQLWVSALGQKIVKQYTVPFPLNHLNECGWQNPFGPHDPDFRARIETLYLGIASGSLVQ